MADCNGDVVDGARRCATPSRSQCAAASLRQLSEERGVPLTVLKRELSNEGMRILNGALRSGSESRPSSFQHTKSIPHFAPGDIVLAPWIDGEYYIAEVVRLESSGLTARIVFTEYNEYSSIEISRLIRHEGFTREDTASNSYFYLDDYDDFSPMAQRVGGGGSNGNAVYSQKHIRVKQRLLSMAPKLRKGPQSTVPKISKVKKK